MTSPTPERPANHGESITESRATVVTIEVGNDRALPSRLANYRPSKRQPIAPSPTGPARPEDLASIIVTVECTGDMTFRPRPKPSTPLPNQPKPGQQEKPAG
jgi:hypothetical protein